VPGPTGPVGATGPTGSILEEVLIQNTDPGSPAGLNLWVNPSATPATRASEDDLRDQLAALTARVAALELESRGRR
jgi:hypothetical protein